MDCDEDFDFEIMEQPLNGLWKLPGQNSDNRLQPYIFQSSNQFWIDLTNQEVQAVLCQRLRAVSSISKAKEWKTAFGTLGAVTSAMDVLKLAQTIRWIYKLYDLLCGEQTPLLQHHFCAESKLHRAMLRLSETEYDAAMAKIASGEKLSFDELMKTLDVHLNCDTPERGYVIFSPDGNYTTSVHLISYFGNSTRAYMSEVCQYHLEQEVRDINKARNDDLILTLAHKYFEMLISEQIQCIQLTVKQLKTDSGIRLQQTFAARYPWQAILSAMLKDVTGGPSPRKCANSGCIEFFIPKKSHQLFCPRPGCRKAASRQRMTDLK